MTMNRTFAAALFALSLVTMSTSAQAQTFAWEEEISSSPVLEQMYNTAGDAPVYQSTFDEQFGS